MESKIVEIREVHRSGDGEIERVTEWRVVEIESISILHDKCEIDIMVNGKRVSFWGLSGLL